MPRPKSGKPHLKALAVKLPVETIEELRRYADLHNISISDVIRQGLDLRLHDPQATREDNGNTVIPSATLEGLYQLSTALEEKLRIMRAGAHAPESFSYNRNTTSQEVVPPTLGESMTVIPLQSAAPSPPAETTAQTPEATPSTAPSSQARAYGEVPSGVLAVLAQRQPATAAELATALGDNSKPGIKRVWQALQRLCHSGKVLRKDKQYRLAT